MDMGKQYQSILGLEATYSYSSSVADIVVAGSTSCLSLMIGPYATLARVKVSDFISYTGLELSANTAPAAQHETSQSENNV